MESLLKKIDQMNETLTVVKVSDLDSRIKTYGYKTDFVKTIGSLKEEFKNENDEFKGTIYGLQIENENLGEKRHK